MAYSCFHMWKYNQSTKAFASQSESCIVYIQIAFQIAAFLSAPPNFPAKAEESSRFVSVSCCLDVFVWHQENKNTSSKSQRDVSLLKKNLVSRNELREIENIGA